MTRQMNSMKMFFIRYVINRIDHWYTVEPRNPNLGSTVPVGNSAKPRFPLERLTLWLGFPCPHCTNDGFSLSLTGTKITQKSQLRTPVEESFPRCIFLVCVWVCGFFFPCQLAASSHILTQFSKCTCIR